MSTSMKKELAKVKKISHPNSRKTIALIKKNKKISNRQKVKLGSFIKQNLVAEKMLWIQENMVDVCPYTPELTAELLKKYIARNDEELEQISIKHSIGGRKNRQHASREDVLRMTKERETEEYETCGTEIPDILNTGQCEMLRKWDGELRYLPNFKFRRFGKKDLNRKNEQCTKKIKQRTKSTSESNKMEAESNKMAAESNKMAAESNKMAAESNKMVAESNKMEAETKPLNVTETIENSRVDIVLKEDVMTEGSLPNECAMIVE